MTKDEYAEYIRTGKRAAEVFLPGLEVADETVRELVAEGLLAESHLPKPKLPEHFNGDRVKEFARDWEFLPVEVQRAMVICREYEEQGAAFTTLLADPPRGFFRQLGGAENATIVDLCSHAIEREGCVECAPEYQGKDMRVGNCPVCNAGTWHEVFPVGMLTRAIWPRALQRGRCIPCGDVHEFGPMLHIPEVLR